MYNEEEQSQSYEPRIGRGLQMDVAEVAAGKLAKPMTLMEMAERNTKMLEELKMAVSSLADKLDPIRDNLPVDSGESKVEHDTGKLAGRMEYMRSQIRQIHNYVNHITREVNL